MDLGKLDSPTRQIIDLGAAQSARPIIFGEVLFDCFPDGKRVLGGAPFNVAWHLKGIGLNPLVISRVGDDEMGGEILETMQNWGLDISGVQIDPERPTGTVNVRFENAEPVFTIPFDQAWDHIGTDACRASLVGIEAPVLYHGTLALRSENSMRALDTCSRMATKRFVDLNLRDPWWDRESASTVASGATWAKLNRDELDAIEDHCSGVPDIDAAISFRHKYDLDGVVLTLGASGAIIAAERAIEGHPPRVATTPGGDTVGAGDAFAAVCLAGIIHGRPTPEVLDSALTLAAEVCQRQGALIHERRIYDRIFSTWRTAR